MIVPMKRLTLVALKADEERIMQALQAICAVQVIKSGDAKEDDATLIKAESDVQRYHNALALMRPYASKPSFLNPKPEMTVNALKENLDGAADISGELEAADRRKTAIRAQIDKHNAQIEMLSPWAQLTANLDELKSTKGTTLFAGRLKEDELIRLKELDELCAVETYGADKERAVLVLCPLSLHEQVGALIKELNWADVNFPKLSMTPAAAIERDRQGIEKLNEELATLEEKLKALGVNRALIATAEDAAVIERDRALAKTTLEKTAFAFVMDAWAGAPDIEAIEKAVSDVTDAYYLDFRDPIEGETPPTIVKNNSFTTPFESVTNLYSKPAYGSIDGTPLMSIWYVLLFGMMLSDTGYGILLSVATWLFVNKAKPSGMMGDLARVLFWGGLSTIVWGVLVGTFFGLDWNLLFGTKGTFPLIVDPGNDPITMLFICFGLGLIHVLFGVCVKIYMSLRDGDWQTAIFDNVSWLMIVIGLLVYALVPAISTLGIVLALVGAAMVLFMRGREKKNIAKRLVSGAGGLYDITGYLSDVLSYARLFALGIATGVIGGVFNQLVGMIMGASDFLPVKIVLVIIGAGLITFLHLFNFGINTMGTFVHCARLQYVEFYGKFYEVGGRDFRPLGFRTRHTRVKDTA